MSKNLRFFLAFSIAALLFDYGLRVQAQKFSGNLLHIANIQQIVKTASNKDGILFIGNSVVNNAVDTELIQDTLNRKNIAKVVPDGSSFWEWCCIINNYILDQNNTPKLLIIGFSWHQLSDQARMRPSMLGGLFCQWNNIPILYRNGMRSIDGLSEFALSKIVHTFALRDTLRNRLLDLLVPYYRQFTREINLEKQNNTVFNADISTHSFTYEEFKRLTQKALERGIQVMLMAMPVQTGYSIDKELLFAAESLNIQIMDFRHVDGITSNSFLDVMHLNAQGRRVFTKNLIPFLENILK